MQMFGNDLNPVAWFIVKQELNNVTMGKVNKLLADIESEVKPQIMPFYACDGPNGEKGTWTYIPSNKVMGDDFDPLKLLPEQRKDYRYEGPEIVYTFWAKHGPCQVTGCGHRTPVMSSPIISERTISVKCWQHKCGYCQNRFDVEENLTRLAPDVPQVVSETELPFSVLDQKKGVTCPFCSKTEMVKLGKGANKKVDLTLLVHPQWLAGAAKADKNSNSFGGSAQDDAVSSSRWHFERSRTSNLLEVRGKLPSIIICPTTGVTIKTGKDGGNVPKKSNYTCASCGTVQDVLTTVKASGKTGPSAAYCVQSYSPLYGGRFFSEFSEKYCHQYNAAIAEWESRKNGDLSDYWPKDELPYGFMTHHLQGGVPNHGHTHWWTLFNSRQLLVNALLLKAIWTTGGTSHAQETREFVLGAFQQFIRCNTLLSIWHMKNNQISAGLSNQNFHPKSTNLEPSVFAPVGDGNWHSAVGSLEKALKWVQNPWELVNNNYISRLRPDLRNDLTGKSEKIPTGDSISGKYNIECESSTDIPRLESASIDLVVTDPPFGGLLHYSELSDFFYVWLRLVLKDKYPNAFTSQHSPKALEVVANKAREPEDPDGFYQRLLTQCWRESHRILKPGGILAFTFHHSEDEPWVAVLESLFDAGFYLEATYPIRSDETKGEGEFGSRTIEYDIIHVCRKRTEEPKAVSWGRMRREVLEDVRQLQQILENHAREGLPAADLQVIKRGKALEYFSRHYGKVYVDEERTISVKDALVGINLLLDEGTSSQEPPPVNAEPMTRQFLRVFDGKTEIARDQMQKFLRGTGMAPDEFVNRGWCKEEHKVFYAAMPMELAQSWIGRHRNKLTYDYDQAMFLIGACFEGSGINATDTLKNENFNPHPALKSLLEWYTRRGATSQIRNAAIRAVTIYNSWAATHTEKARQLELFGEG